MTRAQRVVRSLLNSNLIAVFQDQTISHSIWLISPVTSVAPHLKVSKVRNSYIDRSHNIKDFILISPYSFLYSLDIKIRNEPRGRLGNFKKTTGSNAATAGVTL